MRRVDAVETLRQLGQVLLEHAAPGGLGRPAQTKASTRHVGQARANQRACWAGSCLARVAACSLPWTTSASRNDTSSVCGKSSSATTTLSGRLRVLGTLVAAVLESSWQSHQQSLWKHKRKQRISKENQPIRTSARSCSASYDVDRVDSANGLHGQTKNIPRVMSATSLTLGA